MSILKSQNREGFSDDFAAYLCGSIWEAGADTTANTLIGFVQAMVVYPEAQRIAQAELDRISGERMPEMKDEPQLPYIRACVKETLR